MIKKTFKQIFTKGQPKWFKFLNLSILLPALLYPFVFYTTIFFFDNPKNLGLTYLLFFAVNAYPFYLLLLAYFNSLLFQKSRILGSLLPLAILLTFTFGTIYISSSINDKLSESVKDNKGRAKKGYIGVNNDYKVLDDKVFLHDTLIVGADAKTFEIVSWAWERDKNYYYHFGKRIQYIDRETFEDLDYHYGKDKNHVYYDEHIIEGADAKTFYHIEGSQDGKDANNCYRWGEKVECKVLLTEE